MLTLFWVFSTGQQECKRVLKAENTLEKRKAKYSQVMTSFNDVRDPKAADGTLLFPTDSNLLRDRVWRNFFKSLDDEIHNTINRSESWQRLEDPANLILLFEEVGLAIKEVLDREREFTKNYKAAQAFRQKYGDGEETREDRRRRCLEFIIDLSHSNRRLEDHL